MDLDHLRLLQGVGRCGSLSVAARQAGLSQSAASQAVAQIERSLGQALFDRSCRPVRPTAAGERFLHGLDDALEAFDRAVDALHSSQEELSGTVTVATIPSLGIHLLIGLTQRFADQHPRVRILTRHFDHQMVLNSVRDGRADLGLLSFPPRSRGLRITRLREEPLVVVCHPSHALVAQRRLRLDQLTGQRLVAFDPQIPIRRAIDAALRRHRVHLEVVMELDNIESIKQAVLNRCGLAILPQPMLVHETRARLLMALPIEDVQLQRPIAALCRRGHGHPAAEAFLAFLRASMDEDGPTIPVAPPRYGQTPSIWE
ncbi:MAG: LysR family transcriptional regulator [Planctomycetota bacterium]